MANENLKTSSADCFKKGIFSGQPPWSLAHSWMVVAPHKFDTTLHYSIVGYTRENRQIRSSRWIQPPISNIAIKNLSRFDCITFGG